MLSTLNDSVRRVVFIDIMSRHLDFIGQRADKAVVEDVIDASEVDGDTYTTEGGVVKVVDHYTVSCSECGGDGYYDQIGETICDGCGMVLSGDNRPMIRTEYSEGSEKQIGKGRGVEVDPDRDIRGSMQPAQHGEAND